MKIITITQPSSDEWNNFINITESKYIEDNQYTEDNSITICFRKELVQIPEKIILSNIPVCMKKFKWDVPECYQKIPFNSEGFAELFSDSIFAGLHGISSIGSIYDWIFVYVEDNFCDNDGAGIMVNVNPQSQMYSRIII